MKQSVANAIIMQVTNGIESQEGARINYCISDEKIPQKKTISEYECALDKAVREFFLYGSEDDIVLVLKDAKENQVRPREYKSVDIKNFETNGLLIRKAFLGYNLKGKVHVRIFFTFGSLKIFSKSVEIIGRPKLNLNLCKLIEACQDSISLIQRALK